MKQKIYKRMAAWSMVCTLLIVPQDISVHGKEVALTDIGGSTASTSLAVSDAISQKKVQDSSGNYVYTVNAAGEAVIEKYIGTETKVEIPSVLDEYTVTTIGEFAFLSSDVTKVTIPSTVVELEEFAFGSCIKLKKVTIPASVIKIGETPFMNTKKLSKIEVEEENPNYVSVDGALYDKEKSTLLAVPAKMALTPEETPDSVTCIAAGAFNGNTYLTGTVIPDRITQIGYAAFQECKKLKTVTLGSAVTEVVERTFFYCTALEEIKITGQVTKIENSAFHLCKKMSSINLPDSLKYIGKNAFLQCEALLKIDVPESVETMDECGLGKEKVAVCIRGIYGSAAQKYARKNLRKYKNSETGEIIRYDLGKIPFRSIKKLKVGKKRITLKYKKVSGASYQIRIKKVKVKPSKTYTTKKTKITIKGLKSGQRYRILLRACRKIDGEMYYGVWSQKYVTVK